MKFSIITVCYNAPRLEETCKSIANQVYDDFEWIVIDGLSDSEHINIFNNYKHHMSYFISEKDNGVYYAMNKGIQQLTGDYVIFMNAGDSFYNNFVLLNIAKWLETQEKSPDVIYGITNRNNLNDIHIPPKQFNEYIFFNSSLCHQTSFIKTSLFKEFGPYNTDYRICADFDMFNNYFVHGKVFSFTPVIIANYYTDGLSSNNNEKSNNEKKHIHEKYYDAALLKTIKNQKKQNFLAKIKRRFDHIHQIIFNNRKIFNDLNEQQQMIEILKLENSAIKEYVQKKSGEK